MWFQQLVYALIALFLMACLLIITGILIYIILKRYSGRIFKDQNPKLLNILFVGSILIALSQLFGPLIASTYPIVCGPDASDYHLLFDTVYLDISYNNTTGTYKYMATTDSSGLVYDLTEETAIPFSDSIAIINRITATNLNPLMSYDRQIFLSVEPNNDFFTSLSRPVIMVDQSSILTIKFLKRPSPGTYTIKVIGESADGKMRQAMMVIGISIPVITAFQGSTPLQTAFQGSTTGGSYTYDSTDAIYTTPTSFTGSTCKVVYSGTAISANSTMPSIL